MASFWYRCGEMDHITTSCMAPENTTKVIQKLPFSRVSSAEPKVVSSVRKSSVHTPQPCGLPKGLVGPSMKANVKIEGQPRKTLLESDSRVTIILESWYSCFLSNVPIFPITNLAIWALSNSTVTTYTTHVAVELELHPNPKGAEETISVAVVCTGAKKPDPVPVIIRTNSKKLHALPNHCEEVQSNDEFCSLRICILSPEQPLSSYITPMDRIGHVK